MPLVLMASTTRAPELVFWQVRPMTAAEAEPERQAAHGQAGGRQACWGADGMAEAGEHSPCQQCQGAERCTVLATVGLLKQHPARSRSALT